MTVSKREAPDTIPAVRAALSEGRLSCDELMQAFLMRAAEADDNAFISLDVDGVLAAARRADASRGADRSGAHGLLLGVPVAVKDNIHVAGVRNTAGTRALANYVPADNATAVSRLIEAGAIVIGKTNMHELALGTTSMNAAHGTVRNPWDPKRVSGGSSGGTAAAIAIGSAVAGLGTDTGGSVRIPSSLCGVCGFRPSIGRYPGDGITPNSWTRDTVGPMARSVEDLVLLDSVLSGDATAAIPPHPAMLRLAIPIDAFTTDLGVGVERRWLSALGHLERRGTTLVEVSMREFAELNEMVGMPLALYEIPRALNRYLSTYEIDVTFDELVEGIASPDVATLFADALVDGAPHEVSEIAYREALEVGRPRLQQLYRALFTQNAVDAIAVPTTPLPAVLTEEANARIRLGDAMLTVFEAYRRNCEPSSNAGIPSVSIRLDADADALPLGLQLDGPYNCDRRLLAVARTLERILTPSH